MKQTTDSQTSRRQFLSRTAPLCTLACLGAGQLLTRSSLFAKLTPDQVTHKFDREMPGPKITLRRLARIQNHSFIRFARFLQDELGKERVIELIKKHTDQRLLEQAKKDLKRLGNSDFKSYISIFRDPRMLATLNMEIIVDTDTVFEIKVTDCLAAESFLVHQAGDIGYAAVCWGDYIWAQGFNPKIKLIRDKTLMQGHLFCNHRYVWTG